jgi:hypothetical protein
MSDSKYDITIELLKKAYFSEENFQLCGSWKTQTVAQKVPASRLYKELYNLIPDQVYRPEIYVAFDFTQKFALSMDILDSAGREIKVNGERIVSQATFDNVVQQLLDFNRYYYEYIATYALNAGGDKVKVKCMRLKGASEGEKLFSANTIINYFLTSITVSRVRNAIGTCTLEFRDNAQYNIFGEKFHLFFRNSFPMLAQMFLPMIPFTVWAKGRVYSDFMFPIFTGYITRVTPSNDQGYTSFKIDGRDALELARISMEAVNPAYIQQRESTAQAMNFFTKPLYGLDHMQIVRTLFTGGVLQFDETGRVAVAATDSNTQSGLPKLYPIGNFRAADEEPGNKIRPFTILDSRYYEREKFGINQMLAHLKAPRYVVTWGYNMTPYRTYMMNSPDVYNASFSNRLDLLQGVAGTVYHDFYCDGAGNVHYHPMRLSNDFLLYDSFYAKDITVEGPFETVSKKEVQMHQFTFPYAQVISDEEVTSINKTFNIEEMKTFLMLKGAPIIEGSGDPKVLDLIGSAWDENNLKRFGYRRLDMDCPLVNQNILFRDKNGSTGLLTDAMARAFLDYHNGELYTMSASIVFRPELELSLPLYYVNDSEVFYIQSITHTINIGDNAATTINASFGRQEFEPPVDLLSYMLKTESLSNDTSMTFTSFGNLLDLQMLVNQKVPLSGFVEDKVKLSADLKAKFDQLSRDGIEA